MLCSRDLLAALAIWDCAARYRLNQASGHAPADPSESAIIAELQPGNYTAIVRGVNNTTGVALVEVYDLDR